MKVSSIRYLDLKKFNEGPAEFSELRTPLFSLDHHPTISFYTDYFNNLQIMGEKSGIEKFIALQLMPRIISVNINQRITSKIYCKEQDSSELKYSLIIDSRKEGSIKKPTNGKSITIEPLLEIDLIKGIQTASRYVGIKNKNLLEEIEKDNITIYKRKETPQERNSYGIVDSFFLLTELNDLKSKLR